MKSCENELEYAYSFLVRASSHHSLTKFRSWAVKTHFEFKHGGKVIVDVVRKETFPRLPECKECVKDMHGTEELNWLRLENLDMRRVGKLVNQHLTL